MTEIPSCSCHGEPMEWNKDSRLETGGYWRCKVKHASSRGRYTKSEKGRAAQRRYQFSEKGLASRRRYEESFGGVVTRQISSMFRVRY